MLRSIVIALAVCLTPIAGLAHGGGLDKNGCHTNRKTGDYHCHGTQPARPVVSPAAGSSRSSTGTLAVSPTPTIKVTRGLSRTTIRASDFELVMTTQALLSKLGYRVSVTGIHGQPTRVAIREFQRVSSILEDGEVSGALLVKLAEAVTELGCP